MNCWKILIGICCCVNPAFAQWDTDSVYDFHTRQGIDAVYNLDFPTAINEFETMIALRPKHPAGHFFRAMVEWEKTHIDIDNESYDDMFYDLLDKVIDICDERLDENPDDITALFFKGGSIGFRGRLRAHRDQWLRAANDGRRALPIVRRIQELDPNNYDVLLGTGIYDYFAEAIPDEYPFLKPLMVFFPSGNKEKGIRDLRAASEKAKYAAVESAYFLIQVYYNYEHKPANAMPLALKLAVRFPNNPLFARYLGRCFVQMGIWPEVFRVFSDVRKKGLSGMPGYSENVLREAEYYVGMYYFTTRAHRNALQHFYVCDSLSRILDKKDGPSGFMTMTNLRLGQIYDIQGKRDYALQQYQKVLVLKNHENAHTLAEKYRQTPYK